MIKFKTIKMAAGVITLSAILFTQSVFAQKYKTAADTIKLNIAFGKATLDLANLNADLAKEQNKTTGYQSKSATTKLNASSSAQGSKETADAATNGNANDAKIAMKQARKASNEANDAKDAKSDETNNTKKIADINDKISKKQFELDDMARQKAVIMTQVTPVPTRNL